jgi:nicotinate phosphoribosyltransferase
MAIATSLQCGDALVIVDVQNDFLDPGPVPVPQGADILPVLADYAARFERHGLPVYAVRDWHPARHASFLPRGGSWPEHCVRFTAGADCPSELELPPCTVTISIGEGTDELRVSAFANPHFEASLRTRGVRRLFVGGLAVDDGICETVRDARSRGFEVFFLRDALRVREREAGDGDRAEAEMIRLGAVPLTALDLSQRAPSSGALLTDLFEIGMLQAYFAAGMTDTAVFEFAVRRMPAGRNVLIACGLEPVLQFLEELHFTDWELDWLERTRRFAPGFLASLRGLRFTGDVDALPEGTPCFPHEPLLRVTAPIAQAQLVETRVTNLLHYCTLIASKAVRCVAAAEGRMLVDVGLRRAHGAEAAVLASRACYLAGFTATSDALAAQQFGLPSWGTMSRSFVEAHASEEAAFLAFVRAEPQRAVLLLNTHDARAAAHTVVRLAPAWSAAGVVLGGVRLDGGDLGPTSREVRAILDAGGLSSLRIFASDHLDEVVIGRLIRQGAPIDGFGLGTLLVTSADVPFLDCDYRLQRYAGRGCTPPAEGQGAWPGVKQVYRLRDSSGRMDCDVVARADESHEGEALLVPAMREGRRIGCGETLLALRQRVATELDRLPPRLRQVGDAEPYPVYLSERLHADCLEAGVFAGVGSGLTASPAPLRGETAGS